MIYFIGLDWKADVNNDIMSGVLLPVIGHMHRIIVIIDIASIASYLK